MAKGKAGISAFFFRNFKFSLKKRGGKLRSRKEKTLDQELEAVTTWLAPTSGDVQPVVTDWKTLNQDKYWKYNWPSHHPPPAGPGNGDDVAASHVSKRPAPLCAAFPKIPAFHTAMPTIQLPTTVLFVFIDYPSDKSKNDQDKTSASG